MQLTRPDGRAGFIVPTGIATDETTKELFKSFVERQMLVSLLDFRTGPGLFAEIGHQRFKFCLLTLGEAKAARFVFFALEVSDLGDPRRHFALTLDDFRLINPNTKTCPIFRSQRDAELTKRVYRNVPVLIRDAEEGDSDKAVVPGTNEWGIRFQTMFHMSNDSGLFKRARAEDELPLYEAKMAHQFDHRWATYERGADDARDCLEKEKVDIDFLPTPQYWIEKRHVLGRIARVPKRLAKAWADGEARAILEALEEWFSAQTSEQSHSVENRLLEKAARQISRLLPERPEANRDGNSFRDALTYRFTAKELQMFENCRQERDFLGMAEQVIEMRSPKWLMGWRDITNATNERTVIASVVPRVGVGNSMPIMLFDGERRGGRWAALLANLNSLVLDYIARHKVGGVHVNFFILKQLPLLPPDRYSEKDLEFIVPRVLELTYTSTHLAEWALELGHEGSPFGWDPARRALLRSELDAYFAKLYGLSREELQFVLDPQEAQGQDYPSRTFHRLKENEVRAFGEYRTQRLVLEAWDRLERDQIVTRPTRDLKKPIAVQAHLLAAGAWARPMTDERAEVGAVLSAILKTMSGPMPARQVRLAAMFALQPRQLKRYLSTTEASEWRRLVGAEADPLPQSAAVFDPKTDRAWGDAVRVLRASGHLVEHGDSTWSPGANVGTLETEGWPDGRAKFVLTVLERQSTDAIIRQLPAWDRAWIDAQAA
jgi:hypothetical protein